jgi:predicted O-methyltransferase YrrM
VNIIAGRDERTFPKGWMRVPEMIDLHHLTKHFYDGRTELKGKSLRILEVGSYLGRSSTAMLLGMKEGVAPENYKDCEFYAVDNWSKDGSDRKEFTDNVMKEAPCPVTVLSGDSKLILPQLLQSDKAAYFDLIFIDADHSYEAVKADIINCWPLLSVRGVMAGHDYHRSGTVGVQRAVDEIFKKFTIVERMAGSIWAVRKTSAELGGDNRVFRKG